MAILGCTGGTGQSLGSDDNRLGCGLYCRTDSAQMKQWNPGLVTASPAAVSISWFINARAS